MSRKWIEEARNHLEIFGREGICNIPLGIEIQLRRGIEAMESMEEKFEEVRQELEKYKTSRRRWMGEYRTEHRKKLNLQNEIQLERNILIGEIDNLRKQLDKACADRYYVSDEFLRKILKEMVK